MNSEVLNSQIRHLIKQLLKKQGGTYTGLAEALNLSVPAVKKFMRSGEFSVARLERISDWFGLSLTEFLESAKKINFQPFHFTEEQETLFVQEPFCIYVLFLLGARLSLIDVAQRCQLTSRDFQKILAALDKAKLIEMGPGENVRVIARGPYEWIPGGEMEKKFLPKYLENVKSLISSHPVKGTMQIPFELYLSDRQTKLMQSEMLDLYEKYRKLSRIDHEITPSGELWPVTGLFLLGPYDNWKAVVESLSPSNPSS